MTAISRTFRPFTALVLSLLLGGLCILPIRASDTGFSDVPASSWCAEVVRSMTDAGLIHGYPDGTFRPNATITAAQFVSIVVRCADVPSETGTGTHWASGAMQTALNAGWYDWDELPPTGERYDQPIVRQLAVNILMRALLPDRTGDYNTESAKISDFSALDGRYYNKVLAAYACGVVTGGADGQFRPKSSLTRAQACALIARALALMDGKTSGTTTAPSATTPAVPETPTAAAHAGGVSENGWLQVKGTQLCNQDGNPIELHGMSSHGIQWYPQYTNAQSMQNLASYHANLFRVAMYTGEGGYLSNPTQMKTAAFAAMDAAIANDLYVIIDWHILSDGNPMSHLTEAQSFFDEVSARYADSPAVLYEICNEPNGSVSWKQDIKPYAEAVVQTIRAHAPNSVILIGSGTWSQDLQDPAADPVAGTNLMYTCHFYAGTHGSWLRQRIEQVLNAGLPVFVSEWGVSAADGSGGVYEEASETWLSFLTKHRISWANWSLCDKNETSAALRPGTPSNRAWTDADLSASGRFVFRHF